MIRLPFGTLATTAILAFVCFACGSQSDAGQTSLGDGSDTEGTGPRGRSADESFDTATAVAMGSDTASIERNSSSSGTEPTSEDASGQEAAQGQDPEASENVDLSGAEEPTDPTPQLTTDACPAAVGSGKDGLIDDLEDGDNAIFQHDGRSGYWYTYNDGSGFQTPLAGTPFVPGFEGAGGSKRSAATFGNGFTGWGAGIGFDLTDISRCQYDASAYTGFAFEAKGNVTIRARVAIKETIPTSQGGSCSAMPSDDCNNAHGVDIALNSSWTRYHVAFVDLKQEEGWGIVTKFSAREILKIQFQVKNTNPDQQGIPDFNYAVDNVEFY